MTSGGLGLSEGLGQDISQDELDFSDLFLYNQAEEDFPIGCDKGVYTVIILLLQWIYTLCLSKNTFIKLLCFIIKYCGFVFAAPWVPVKYWCYTRGSDKWTPICNVYLKNKLFHNPDELKCKICKISFLGCLSFTVVKYCRLGHMVVFTFILFYIYLLKVEKSCFHLNSAGFSDITTTLKVNYGPIFIQRCWEERWERWGDFRPPVHVDWKFTLQSIWHILCPAVKPLKWILHCINRYFTKGFV